MTGVRRQSGAEAASRALPVRLAVNLALPVPAYILLRPYVHSAVAALVASAAIPAVYTAGVLLWRRRLDAIGVFAVACFAIGVLLVAATGGNELVFKLREDIWTAPLGLACLISVAAGHPLSGAVLKVAARRDPQLAGRNGDPRARRISAMTTGVTGVILLVHALAMAALALTTSTAAFLALSRPLSLAIVGGGLAALAWWIRRQRPGSPAHDHPSDCARQGSRKEG